MSCWAHPDPGSQCINDTWRGRAIRTLSFTQSAGRNGCSPPAHLCGGRHRPLHCRAQLQGPGEDRGSPEPLSANERTRLAWPVGHRML